MVQFHPGFVHHDDEAAARANFLAGFMHTNEVVPFVTAEQAEKYEEAVREEEALATVEDSPAAADVDDPPPVIDPYADSQNSELEERILAFWIQRMSAQVWKDQNVIDGDNRSHASYIDPAIPMSQTHGLIDAMVLLWFTGYGATPVFRIFWNLIMKNQILLNIFNLEKARIQRLVDQRISNHGMWATVSNLPLDPVQPDEAPECIAMNAPVWTCGLPPDLRQE